MALVIGSRQSYDMLKELEEKLTTHSSRFLYPNMIMCAQIIQRLWFKFMIDVLTEQRSLFQFARTWSIPYACILSTCFQMLHKLDGFVPLIPDKALVSVNYPLLKNLQKGNLPEWAAELMEAMEQQPELCNLFADGSLKWTITYDWRKLYLKGFCLNPCFTIWIIDTTTRTRPPYKFLMIEPDQIYNPSGPDSKLTSVRILRDISDIHLGVFNIRSERSRRSLCSTSKEGIYFIARENVLTASLWSVLFGGRIPMEQEAWEIMKQHPTLGPKLTNPPYINVDQMIEQATLSSSVIPRYIKEEYFSARLRTAILKLGEGFYWEPRDSSIPTWYRLEDKSVQYVVPPYEPDLSEHVQDFDGIRCKLDRLLSLSSEEIVSIIYNVLVDMAPLEPVAVRYDDRVFVCSYSSQRVSITETNATTGVTRYSSGPVDSSSSARSDSGQDWKPNFIIEFDANGRIEVKLAHKSRFTADGKLRVWKGGFVTSPDEKDPYEIDLAEWNYEKKALEEQTVPPDYYENKRKRQKPCLIELALDVKQQVAFPNAPLTYESKDGNFVVNKFYSSDAWVERIFELKKLLCCARSECERPAFFQRTKVTSDLITSFDLGIPSASANLNLQNLLYCTMHSRLVLDECEDVEEEDQEEDQEEKKQEIKSDVDLKVTQDEPQQSTPKRLKEWKKQDKQRDIWDINIERRILEHTTPALSAKPPLFQKPGFRYRVGEKVVADGFRAPEPRSTTTRCNTPGIFFVFNIEDVLPIILKDCIMERQVPPVVHPIIEFCGMDKSGGCHIS